MGGPCQGEPCPSRSHEQPGTWRPAFGLYLCEWCAARAVEAELGAAYDARMAEAMTRPPLNGYRPGET